MFFASICKISVNPGYWKKDCIGIGISEIGSMLEYCSFIIIVSITSPQSLYAINLYSHLQFF